MPRRRSIPIDIRRLVLHECGYRCGNPVCGTILTLDVHHLDPVSEGGLDDAENLLPLCPNCHAQHHAGIIPRESLRAWKMTLIALNEAVDRRGIDVLLALDGLAQQPPPNTDGIGQSPAPFYVSGDGLLECAGLIASSLAMCSEASIGLGRFAHALYKVELTPRGRKLVEAYRRGDQAAFVGEVPTGWTRS